jgi:hypothetical protein
MPEFKLNGKTYDIPEDIVEQFLKDNPSAEALGKTTPTAPGAVVEETAAPELTLTESPSVNISLALPKTGTVDSTIKKPKTKTDSELKIDATRNVMSIANPIASIMPDFMIPVLADWTAMTAETAAGVVDTAEIAYEMAISPDWKTFDKISRKQRIDMSEVYEGAEALRNIREKKYDDQGNELDAIGLWEAGRKVESAQQFASEAIGSLPSTVLTYMLPGAGSLLIGAGTLGKEFETNLKERPQETADQMLLNASIKGGSEAFFEWVGGHTFKTITKAAGRGLAENAVKELTKNSVPYVLGKLLGIGGQALSEATTEALTGVTQLAADELVFDDSIEAKQYWRTAIHSGIVGGLMGGGITAGAVGAQITGNRKKAALSIITPKQWKSEQIQIGREIDQAVKDYQAASPNKKKFFKNKIEVLEQRQQGRAEKLVKTWDGLTRVEKMNYAKLLDEADSQLDIIGNNKYTKKAQDDAQLSLNDAYSGMQNILGKDNIDASIEQNISKTLKASQSILEQVKKAKTIKNLNIEYLSDEQAKAIGMKNADAAFQNNIVYINKDISALTGQTNVIGHELLHYMMAKNFNTSNESMQPLVDSFKDYLKNTQPEIFERVESRINSLYTNKKTGKIEKGALEEYLNVFSDLIAKEKIVVNENFSDKIKNSTTRFLNGLGFGSIKLETGKDVFNFIRNYNKNISNFKYKQLGIDITSNKISKGINEVVSKQSKSISGENIQKIFDEKGKDGTFEIIEAYKPLTTKLTNKYRDVPGFDFELLQSEIEIGKRGLLDLINAYDPSKGATLNTYIQGQLANRSIEAANRILDTEFKLDVTEAKGVTDTVTAEETIEREEAAPADEIKSLRKEIGLSEELVTKVKDAVVKTFGTKLPNPQDPKFRFELQKRFRTELKKPLSKFVGKQADYEAFLRDNFESVYSKMPQSLINRRFKEFAEPVLDKNGKQLRERTAEGNKVYVKKKISKAEWIKYFIGADVKSSTKGARKTAIVEGMAEEIAFDATMEVLNDPDVISKYQNIAEITGDILPDNYLAQIAKQIDRNEDFKFSKSILNDSGLSNQELSSILFKGFISAAGKLDPKIIEVLLDDAWTKSFPRVLEEYILPGYAEAIKNKSIEEQSDISKYLINIISRPLRTISRQTEELNYNTNYRLFKKLQEIAGDKVFGPNAPIRLDEKIIEYKEGPNKGKFKEKRTYIRDVDGVALGSSTYNTSVQGFHKDLINDKLSRKEVDGVFSENRNRLKELIFSLGTKNKGLAISLIKLTQKDQRGLLRSSGHIGGIVQNYNGETVFEHRPPVQYLFEKIVDYIEKPTNAKKEKLNTLLDTAQINVVPKDFADIVDQEYKTTIPSNGKISYENALNKTNYEFDGIFKFSKSLNKDFNKILEQSTGINWARRFSPVEARVIGKGKGKKFFIPYSADDFVGLLYATLGKGKVGDQQMEWYKENLLRPFSRGIQQYEAAKQKALRDWQALKKEAKKDVPGGLGKKNATGLSNQDAVRIYIWATQGMDIPGTEGSPELIQQNLEAVKADEKLKAFADRLMALNPEGYPEPSDNWDSGDITTDIVSYINGVKRSEFLTEWKENVDEIFSDQNKEKLRALYGDSYIEALDDMLHRMRTGTNRKFGVSKIERQFMDWTNNSVGAIMFFNARSAVLQTLSAVNFINFSDNNPINAGIAFANQRQYWNDFSTLFNSNFLKQRRTGLQTDVNADEIARAAKTSTNKARAALSALLKLGFTPTQIADSFAIASGGATFYRNRIKKYLKEGLEQKEAEQKAFTDFQEIAEETQQSARPDRISLQQASSLGRLILAFGNTPMQYARLTKKATLDLINGRGDWKTNISKIAYYSVIQNIIFSALQQGLFALLFDDEDDDKEKSRLFRIGNSSFDTLLRGAGVYGAAAATAKNMIIKVIEETKKSRPDYTKVAIEATAISPPINSKLRKLVSAGKTFTYKQSKEKVFTEGFSLENPAFLAGGKILSATTNLPADRVVQKADHLYTAMQPETELWQSIALSLGWSEWDLNMIENQTKKPKKIQPNFKTKSFKSDFKTKKFKTK